MGSSSDWSTMKEACEMLEYFDVSYIKQVVSAHRTPLEMVEFAKNARNNEVDIIIAGAGGAAHLPGMVASMTTVPVIGVPIETKRVKRNGFITFYRTNAGWNSCSNNSYR